MAGVTRECACTTSSRPAMPEELAERAAAAGYRPMPPDAPERVIFGGRTRIAVSPPAGEPVTVGWLRDALALLRADAEVQVVAGPPELIASSLQGRPVAILVAENPGVAGR
jgi:hypothetical protein